jgi:hypothetical protein
MRWAVTIRGTPGIALGPATLFDIFNACFFFSGAILSLKMKLGHLGVSLHEFRDSSSCGLWSWRSLMDDRLESTLFLRLLIFYFLSGLISDGLLQLLEMFGEFVKLTALILINNN